MDQTSNPTEKTPVTIQNLAELKHWLLIKGIDISKWGAGAAKTVESLWHEISAGEIYLQDTPPLRIGAIVKVIIRQGNNILIEVEQILGHNRQRFRNHPPSEKMKPFETYLAAAARCLHEELGLAPPAIEIGESPYHKKIEERESPSYPGLRTRYILHTVEAKVRGLPDTDFWTVEEVANQQDPVKKHHWAWQPQTDID